MKGGLWGASRRRAARMTDANFVAPLTNTGMQMTLLRKKGVSQLTLMISDRACTCNGLSLCLISKGQTLNSFPQPASSNICENCAREGMHTPLGREPPLERPRQLPGRPIGAWTARGGEVTARTAGRSSAQKVRGYRLRSSHAHL
eukprot:1141287-Pelagomonas_calceolata.AAC.2